MMTDLFGANPLPGFSAQADVLSAREESALIARIDSAALAPFRFQGWTGKRLTASFGASYDFDVGRAVEAAPIPDWLRALQERAGELAGIDATALVQALIIRYDPGAGIGWHRDRPIYEHVVGVSLGAPAVMRFRRRRAGGFDRATAPLEPRAGYHLGGAARYEWEHSIAPLAAPRWSITFRSLAEPR